MNQQGRENWIITLAVITAVLLALLSSQLDTLYTRLPILPTAVAVQNTPVDISLTLPATLPPSPTSTAVPIPPKLSCWASASPPARNA